VETPLSFEQSDKAGCGIELCVNGLCVSWHFQAALDALKRATDDYRDRETDNGAADAR